MQIRCRAKLSKHCYDGKDCREIYGLYTMSEDNTFDGETVVCDACYLLGGRPAIRAPASRQDVIDHVNRELGIDGD